MRTMHQFGRAMDRLRPVIAALALIGVLAAQTSAARAEDKDDGPANRAPRVTVQIGDVNVVLVSSDDQLYAFVDRIEDNAPAGDAAITVTRTGSHTPLAFTKASSGLFVAPYKRTGLVQDYFTVSVASADGTGEEKATLVYDAAPVAAVRSTNGSFGRLLSIALVSGMIGSVATVLLMRRLGRGGRRADPPPPLVRVA